MQAKDKNLALKTGRGLRLCGSPKLAQTKGLLGITNMENLFYFIILILWYDHLIEKMCA